MKEIDIVISARNKFAATSIYKLIKDALFDHGIMINVDIDEEQYMIAEDLLSTTSRADHLAKHDFVVVLRTEY